MTLSPKPKIFQKKSKKIFTKTSNSIVTNTLQIGWLRCIGIRLSFYLVVILHICGYCRLRYRQWLYFKTKDTKKSINNDFKYFCDKFVSFPLTITGFDVFNPNYRLHWVSYLTLTDIVSYLIVNGYSIYLFSEDLKSTCFCMVTYGYAIVGSLRIFLAIVNAETARDLRDIVVSFEFDEKSEIKERQRYLWYGRVSRFLGTLSMLALCITFTTLTLAPFLIWLVTGRMQLTFGFVLPFIDYKSGKGFVLNYIYQIYQGLAVIAGSAGYLHMQMIFIAICCFQLDLLSIKLEKLDDELKLTQDVKSSKTKQILEILKLHQNYNAYLSVIEDCFCVEAFFSTFFLSLNMVVTLFVCVQEFWIVGIVITITVTNLILLTSLFGVAVEIKAEKLERSIYGTQWYNLTIQDQKLLLQFLLGAQNRVNLTYAGMFAINLESFTQIYKSIYSYLMFLIDIQA
ncbi:odorant receptor 67d-like [Culicoides brevitarsis]|uniref:odorant receptor 67d-like n=1 Tax=Culicoides brevitarsis TaxID=469753 RepID=UPI00307C36C0